MKTPLEKKTFFFPAREKLFLTNSCFSPIFIFLGGRGKELLLFAGDLPLFFFFFMLEATARPHARL